MMNQNFLFVYVGLLMFVASGVNAQPECFAPIAKYIPDSDVTQHTLLDKDIQEINTLTLADDFEQALDIYTAGKNSLKTTGTRKLKDFSTTAQSPMTGQTYFELYKSYWNSATYGDDMFQAAYSMQEPYNNVDVAFQTVVRREVMIKTIQYQIVWMYVIREMEDAIDDCQAGTIDNNDAGVHAWDEAWAFYAGSIEGVNGTGNGFSLYAGAHKRCAQFGTCLNGQAMANKIALGLFAQGQALLRTGACEAAAAVIPKIVSQMTIPLIQGALRYVLRGSTNDGWAGSATDFNKERAEGYAFIAAVLPQIAACDATAADVIQSNTVFNANPYMAAGMEAVVDAFQSTYKCMGIKCSEIGAMTEKDVNDAVNVIFPTCVDPTDVNGPFVTAAPTSTGFASKVSVTGSALLAMMMSWYLTA